MAVVVLHRRNSPWPCDAPREISSVYPLIRPRSSFLNTLSSALSLIPTSEEHLAVVAEGMTWQEELTGLVGDTGIRYAAVAEEEERGAGGTGGRVLGKGYFRVYEEGAGLEESLKEQVTGFVVATGEMLRELGRGFWDVAQQSLEGVGETYVGKKVRGHWDAVLQRLEFVNEYLPEDRDPVHAWPIVITVFLLALLGFGESDPHPVRDLNSSAMDMLHLANALGVTEKFWIVGYSGGAMHAWAAVHYIPDRLAGVMQVFFREFWEKDAGESVRQGDVRPFVEEAMLQVSNWGFGLADLQVQNQHQGKGLLPWIKSLYGRAEHEQAGFLSPIHVWQ
ncbi:hypothetical protein B296_00015745, partial [Ensete ventricosum]